MSPAGSSIDIHRFTEATGLKFQNEDLLIQALTHSSFANQKRHANASLGSNERLEFFGDSVLKLLVSEFLYWKYPSYAEGQLSKLRAKMISDHWLVAIAKSLSLGTFIRFAKGELASGGDQKPSNLANTFEAILGALFLDQGLDAARDFLHPFLEDALHKNQHALIDPKTELQELLQRNAAPLPVYRIHAEQGPEHEKHFEVIVEIHLKGRTYQVAGSGTNKKSAEQNAALAVLKELGEVG